MDLYAWHAVRNAMWIHVSWYPLHAARRSITTYTPCMRQGSPCGLVLLACGEENYAD